ncbi:unnamed protein product [Spirodela intermedia]|uniref:Uncharacterized protein n=1 Tax=Spirodela intermedia TaxID=51605 RepID=A0A7I8KHM1_SPIIN|nr:unnamed protein product [Spirodela intermedia]
MASPWAATLCKSRDRLWNRGGSLRRIPIGSGFRKKNNRSAGAASSKAIYSNNQPDSIPAGPPQPQLPLHPDLGAASLCASTSDIYHLMLNLYFPGLEPAFAVRGSNVDCSVFPGIFLGTRAASGATSPSTGEISVIE